MLEAVIFAGGRGLRLKGFTDIPKPFLVVNQETGETLLDAQLNWLWGHGFEHVILTFSRPTFKYARLNYPQLLNLAAVDITIEEEPLGTAGALKKALPFIEEELFYCFNVDDVVDYDPREMMSITHGKNMLLIQKAVLPFGLVKLAPDMRVIAFEEKPRIDAYVSCGHYVFNKRLITELLPDEGDIEKTLLRDLAKLGLLYAYELKGKWITINTMKDLLQVLRREDI